MNRKQIRKIASMTLVSFIFSMIFAFGLLGQSTVQAGYERGRVKVVGDTILTDQNTRLRGATFYLYGWKTTELNYAKSTAAWDNLVANRFNAVRLACAYRPGTSGNLSLDQYQTLLDDMVSKAAARGLYVMIDYHPTPGSYNMTDARNFWTRFAPRYADRTHVIYEVVNEPVSWTPSAYTQTNVNDFKSLYTLIRGYAPNTHLALFSFAVATTGMVDVVNMISGIDWTKTSVAFHPYHISSSSGIDELKASSYPCFASEFEMQETTGNMKYIDGYRYAAELMEDKKLSWFQWDISQHQAAVDDNMVELINRFKSVGKYWTADDYNNPPGPTPTPTPTSTPTPTPGGTTIDFNLSADAYVRGGTYASTNYGTAATFEVKGSPTADNDRIGYVKVNYSGYTSSSASSAKLYLYLTDTQATAQVPVKIYGYTSDSWSETGVTYNSQPSSSGAVYIGTINVQNTGWYNIDVTDFVNSQMSDKTVTFKLVDESQMDMKLIFSSREDSSNKPYLRLQYPTQTNVMVNPGFENGTTSWDPYGTVSSQTTNVHSGSYSCKIGGASSNGIKQTISGLSPNTAYTVTVYAKASSSAESFNFYVKDFGGTQITKTISGTSYAQYSITFTTGAANTSAAVCIWKGSGSNVAYVDDFYMSK